MVLDCQIRLHPHAPSPSKAQAHDATHATTKAILRLSRQPGQALAIVEQEVVPDIP